jgi:TetR/AcrR family transcriptional regulator, repressor of fatR-cypB operon
VEKREKIIESAMKLLIDNGVQGTPMSAIAKAADTGMGTIYNYFATKEDLINAIYLYIKENETLTLAMSFADESIKRRFDHYYQAFILYFVGHPLHFAFMDQFHSSPILTPATKEEGMKTMAPFIGLIAKGQREGIIKQIDFNELLFFVNGGIMGFVRWVLREQVTVHKGLLDNQLRIAWDAIKQ